MPKPTIEAGSPCWIELASTDPQRAMEFYAKVFGWSYEIKDQQKYGGYTMALKDGASVAGIMLNDGSNGATDLWSTYLRVNDIDAVAEAAVAHGGQLRFGPMDVPEQGKMAVLADAGGAEIGLFEFGGHTGFGLASEPGAPTWHELHTRDYDSSVQFYREVFGWETSVMSNSDDFRYTTLGEGEGAKAGIMDAGALLTESTPPHWLVYFGVADTDDAVQKAVATGGQVVQAAEDTPFGRQAVLRDPTGAEFWIIQDPAQD
ncbi:VOC family protein [Paeniglutamicibacter antarcticus]|uniref:VOC family protein n=1 Tax=Paeniglutamicibacter antarcticus TaxID=494023 RepID=A0ABP9TNC9_9MICC